MGPLGSPNGGSFFFVPEPSKGIPFEDLYLNVLRSLQFSYMMMKGLRSTTRALRNLDLSRDEGMSDGTRGGRYSWRAAGTVGGGKVDRIGTGGISSNRIRIGRYTGGRSRGGARTGSGVPGRRGRCTGADLGNVARGEGNWHGKGEGTGATPGKSEYRGNKLTGGKGVTGGNGECQGRKSTEGGDRGGQFGDMKLDTTNTQISEGANGPVLRKDISAKGRPNGESRVPADYDVMSTSSDGMINRTLSVAGLGAVDSISNQLKPMKGFMKSVKMATGVVSGVKTATGVIQKFQAPAGGVLIGFGAANGVVLGFETARMIVKGAKISKDFASVWKSTGKQIGGLVKSEINTTGAKATREKLWKGVKASDGALTLVKLTKEFGAGLGGSLQDGLTNWDLVSKSYDASNSVLKVFEAALGLKGGGMIGVVGKGFTVLKGAIGGLGVSVKLVKAVAISKEISIVLLKGFGISKTAIEAFKAAQEGKRMVRWFIFKDGSKDFQKLRTVKPLKGKAISSGFELVITCTEQSAAGRHDNSPSLIYSLASLLLAKSEACDLGDPDEDGLTSPNIWPPYIFSLSFPIYCDRKQQMRAICPDYS